MKRRDLVKAVVGRILYMLLGAALLILGLTYMAPAGAATFRGDQASCDHLSAFAGQVAELRDSGTAWEQFEAWIKLSLERARENPDSYVKDQDDVDFVMAAFKRIYDNPQMTPEQAVSITSAECMKRPTSLKHGSV